MFKGFRGRASGAEPWSWDVARCLYEGDALAKLSKALGLWFRVG